MKQYLQLKDTSDLVSIEADRCKQAREKRIAKQAKQGQQTALALNNRHSKCVDEEEVPVATGKSDSSSKKKKVVLLRLQQLKRLATGSPTI